MDGLRFLGHVGIRPTREEFQILVDRPVYEAVKRYTTQADMQEIDGWARSFYTLEGHLESIMQFSKPLLPEPTDSAWADTKREVYAQVTNLFPKVNSLMFEQDMDRIPYEAASAAGYGYSGKKGEGDNFSRAKSIANAAVRQFNEDIDKFGFDLARNHLIEQGTPDVAFTRTQLAKLPSIKVRIVFGEAFHNILIEGLSAAPLLAAFKSADTFYVTGKDPTIFVPKLLFNLGLDQGWFICLDWKAFDATVQLWEIDHAFNCLKGLLNFPSLLTERAFEYARESFKQRKLAAPDGTLWMRTSGIPSGSYFTNIIGSIINYTRIKYLCNREGLVVRNCYVQGDDSITWLTSSPRPDIYRLAEIGEPFGWRINLMKTLITDSSQEVTFLGRSQIHQFNIRERLKVLRLMCFPEYEVQNPAISTARVRAIARDAGFRDPLYNKILYLSLIHI